MQINFYQICYSKESSSPIAKEFRIFDQINNPYSLQRETFHFIDFFEKGFVKQNKNFYALLSPKFLNKISCDFNRLKKIAKNKLKNHDVFLINTDPKMVYFFFNVWEQGDYFHPGLKKIVSKIPSINTDYRNDIITAYYSNYFIANYEFWNLFVNYIKDKITDIEKFAKKDLYKSVDNHFAPLYVFILERLLSNFIYENKNKFRISQYKYTKEEILKTTTNFFDRYLINKYLEVIDNLDLEKSNKVKKIIKLIRKKRIEYKNKTFIQKFLLSIRLQFDHDILKVKDYL